MSGKQPSGIVSVPYLLKATKTSVNGKTVWHSNPFINGYLKWVRFLLIFIKRNNILYKNINSKYILTDYN